MRRCLCHGVLIIFSLSVEAQAGYRDLLTDIESYQPPPVVASQLESKGVGPSSPVTLPDDDDFQAQRAGLKAQEDRWRKALNAPDQGARFLVPEPALLASLQVAAQDDDAAGAALADGFTMETLEALALLRSPVVHAKEREFEGVLASYGQAEHLDTILRRYASLTKSVMTGVGGMTNPDPAALKFPFPGVLALKGQIVGQEAKAALEGVEAARRDAVTAVRKACAELVYVREALEIIRSQLGLMANQQQAVSTRYQAGDTEFEAVLRVGILLEQTKEELTSLVEEQANVEMAIRSVLSLPGRIKIGRPAVQDRRKAPSSLDALYALALERRQEIRGKQALVGRSERMVAMAEIMVYPGFTPNRSAFEADAVSPVGQGRAMARPEPSPVAAEPGAGAVLPETPWFGADDAYLRQARFGILALTKEVEAERAATVLGVREAWYRLDKARRQESLYRDRISTLAQARFDAAGQAYSAGRGAFSEFIESANAWLDARLGLARAKADSVIAQAELDAAVGVRGDN